MNRLQFITAIPAEIRRGSGCYVGTRTLVEGLRRLGNQVDVVRPGFQLPVFTATRVLFNETLRSRDFRADATIGIDADGYAISGRRRSPPHIACIKGVLADAVRFESGLTCASMAFHAWLEAGHARRADLVVTISRYCAGRIEELYGVKGAVVVPELIDLNSWRHLFRSNPGTPDSDRFTILSVCRFYPRKSLDTLLQAAAQLRHAIPRLQIRIVGNGPECKKLHRIARDLQLEGTVCWLGDLPLARLAQEYNRAHVFCLPSLQEGFGIVFLEAMAAGKPIVGVRAAAVPEVVRKGFSWSLKMPRPWPPGLCVSIAVLIFAIRSHWRVTMTSKTLICTALQKYFYLKLLRLLQGLRPVSPIRIQIQLRWEVAPIDEIWFWQM
jgi:glycosyltransferase involved in cell wall biosynthesis